MKIHIVQEGDTLWGLAQKYNVPKERLLETNPEIDEFKDLKIGSKVRVPTGKVTIQRPQKMADESVTEEREEGITEESEALYDESESEVADGEDAAEERSTAAPYFGEDRTPGHAGLPTSYLPENASYSNSSYPSFPMASYYNPYGYGYGYGYPYTGYASGYVPTGYGYSPDMMGYMAALHTSSYIPYATYSPYGLYSPYTSYAPYTPSTSYAAPQSLLPQPASSTSKYSEGSFGKPAWESSSGAGNV